MKLAFMISIALILPIFTAYFVVNALPLHSDKIIELNESVGVTDNIKTHITHHTQDYELDTQMRCRSGVINIAGKVLCNV